MNVTIFKRNLDWIVIVGTHDVTFHQTLAGAMEHASAQIRSPDNLGETPKDHYALYDG